MSSCSSGAEDELDDPSNKAVREKERRQANNVRERYVTTIYFATTKSCISPSLLIYNFFFFIK